MRPDGGTPMRLALVVPVAALLLAVLVWVIVAQQRGGPLVVETSPASASVPAETASESAASETEDTSGSDERLRDETNTIEVAERFGPSVVAIDVVAGGDVVEPPGGLPGAPGPSRQGAGSGFLIEFEDHPYLVTNYHVVALALVPDSVELLPGGQLTARFQADPDQDVAVEVVGLNPSFDLALLRLLDASDLPQAEPLAIGDSDALQVGQKTIAIGNPFGLANSVSSGIVSAVGRFVPTVSGLDVPMVQTDAAINPGNSGGPLLDSQGRLIGINTALINPTGRSFAGLGFAVPSNLLQESLANLELGGITDVSRTRPRLGIAAQSMSLYPPEVRERFGLPAEGVAVIEVMEGSVAERAGLLGSAESASIEGSPAELPIPRDVIVAVDGEPIGSVEELSRLVTFESEPGDELTFTVVRDGAEVSVPMKLEIVAAETSPG